MDTWFLQLIDKTGCSALHLSAGLQTEWRGGGGGGGGGGGCVWGEEGVCVHVHHTSDRQHKARAARRGVMKMGCKVQLRDVVISE